MSSQVTTAKNDDLDFLFKKEKNFLFKKKNAIKAKNIWESVNSRILIIKSDVRVVSIYSSTPNMKVTTPVSHNVEPFL